MRILKKTKKDLNNSTGERFFGAYLPDETHEFIALYTESHGITKTDVLREMSGEWLKKVKDDDSVSNLVSGLVVKVRNQIAALKNSRHYNPSEVRMKLEKELLKKGISGEIVDKIITNIYKR